MYFFTGIFQGFCLLFRSTYRVTASVSFNKETIRESIYFPGKYYTREYLNVKIPHSKLFQGEFLFPGGSIY